MNRFSKPQQKLLAPGFTLLELIVSMSVTLFIVGGLVAVTSSALDTFRNSTNNVRSYKQAKTAIDQLSQDLEAIVIRSGNNFEWLSADAEVGSDAQSGNALFSRLVFLSAVPDRYNGQTQNAGDVSCLEYAIAYQNPITGATESDNTDTFVLYRKLTNPRDAFTTYLAQADLSAAADADTASPVTSANNFICENIKEMSIVFHLSYLNDQGDTNPSNDVNEIIKIPVIRTETTSSNHCQDFSVTGQGVVGSVSGGDINVLYPNARISAIDINLQIIDDSVVALTNQSNSEEQIEKKVQRFTKTIHIPQL